MDALASLWTLANSPVGVALIVAAVAWLIKRSVTAQSIADKYGGTLIQLIKAAEKAIPDDVSSPGLRRFDWVLKRIAEEVHVMEGRWPTDAERDQLAQAVSVEHAKLEADGNLTQAEERAGVGEGERAGASVNLNSFIGWIACAGLLVSMVAGCASDNATQIYGKAATISTALHESAIAYHVTAVAANVTPADRYAVEKRMDLVLQGVAAVVDSLQADAAAYQAASAAGNAADAEAANSRARMSLNALNALATRLAAEYGSTKYEAQNTKQAGP